MLIGFFYCFIIPYLVTVIIIEIVEFYYGSKTFKIRFTPYFPFIRFFKKFEK